MDVNGDYNLSPSNCGPRNQQSPTVVADSDKSFEIPMDFIIERLLEGFTVVVYHPKLIYRDAKTVGLDTKFSTPFQCQIIQFSPCLANQYLSYPPEI